jgi:hypothetical protein
MPKQSQASGYVVVDFKERALQSLNSKQILMLAFLAIFFSADSIKTAKHVSKIPVVLFKVSQLQHFFNPSLS